MTLPVSSESRVAVSVDEGGYLAHAQVGFGQITVWRRASRSVQGNFPPPDPASIEPIEGGVGSIGRRAIL